MQSNSLFFLLALSLALPANIQQTTSPLRSNPIETACPIRRAFRDFNPSFIKGFRNFERPFAEGFNNFDQAFRDGFRRVDRAFRDAFNDASMAFDISSKPSGTLTEAERKYAVDLLQKTRADLLASVNGLSEAQLTYKADPARWSVAECLEHIALAEMGIFMQEQGAMKAPADPARRSEIKVTDEQIVQILTNRSGRVQSPEVIRPTGRFPSAQASLQAFGQQRDRIIDYVQTVQDDLRTHYWKHPATGTIDAYQTIVLIAAHMERHRLQIEEVKASAGFPKA